MILEIAAPVVSLTAAITMAFGRADKVWIAMILWVFGSILWFMYGLKVDSVSLMLTSVGYLFIETIGLIKWWAKR
jgi:hypothetical protein